MGQNIRFFFIYGHFYVLFMMIHFRRISDFLAPITYYWGPE